MERNFLDLTKHITPIEAYRQSMDDARAETLAKAVKMIAEANEKNAEQAFILFQQDRIDELIKRCEKAESKLLEMDKQEQMASERIRFEKWFKSVCPDVPAPYFMVKNFSKESDWEVWLAAKRDAEEQQLLKIK